MINVTKTFLPPLDEYVRYLEGIWERGHITNHGPCSLELEKKLKEFLRVKHLLLVNNGTIALQIAIKALDLKGEIITTPFSYVATTSSIVWENCTPIFADIDEKTLCIDPVEVEKCVTGKTSAILTTHVYGNPSAVDELESIARRHKLKVIYDAAHAFGVKLDGTSILNRGDISTLSFHATKVFHTVEGGALITNDDETAHRIEYMRNFGHNGPEAFFGVGINGKISEPHAAMGLLNLKYFDEGLSSRKKISQQYDYLLKNLPLTKPIQPADFDHNYGYYPVIFQSAEISERVKGLLNKEQINPRRYFFPSLNELPYLERKFPSPVSESISRRVLCLPLYSQLDEGVVDRICAIIVDALDGIRKG